MDYLAQNHQWLFSGLLPTILAIIVAIGIAFYTIKSSSRSYRNKNIIKGSNNNNNNIAGRDINIVNKRKRNE